MRISKADLMRRWGWSTGLAVLVLAILWALDLKLKAETGVGTADIQAFDAPIQFEAAFRAWGARYAGLAGFNLGFDYLLMPLYALSFFYSAIIAAEAFAPRAGRLRRIILFLAMVPAAGALCDAGENALQLTMLLGGPDEMLARLAFTLSNAKTVALTIGGVLLAAAIVARFPRRPKSEDPTSTY
jgi:hypothetical protein